MSFKTRRMGENRSIDETSKLSVNNPAFVAGSSATYIAAGQVVTINGRASNGSLMCEEAINGGQEANLWVALNEIREYGTVVRWFIKTQDTSTSVLEAPAYLDTGTAGNVVFIKPAGLAVRVGTVITAAADGRILLHPGTEAPSAGSTATVIADPGAVVIAIPVTNSGTCLITSVGVETRTIADPTFIGQKLIVAMDVDGGAVTVTTASPYDVNGRTTFVLDDAGDAVVLEGIQRASALEWLLTGEDMLLAQRGDHDTVIADPGDAGTIAVTTNGTCALTSGGPAETRTLAIPTFIGQRIVVSMDTDGGGAVILTAASAINPFGRTTVAFRDIGDTAVLIGVSRGGTLQWDLAEEYAGRGNLSNIIADPGDVGTLIVDTSGTCLLTSGGAAETRVLPIPTFLGQELLLSMTVDAGDITVTSASTIDAQAGRTDIVFDAVGDTAHLKAVDQGGTLFWSLLGEDIGEILDPGSAVALPVDRSGSIAITTAAAETNTLPDPTFLGQRLSLGVDVYAVGDRVVTAASAINLAGNTIMTFGVADDIIILEAFRVAGSLVWRVVLNIGVALS